MTLTIWLPPQFDVQSGSPAGDILKQALQDYQKDHPEILVDVRVKAPEGPAGLLESLAAAEPVAPAVVPSIIALQRPDLETAALKGMIYPLEAEAAGLQDADWFAYARDLARVQDTVFGLPFAGDALLMLYRPGHLSFIPTSWEQILVSGMGVSLPAGDPQALASLALYLSAGGAIQDEQGRPLLELETLQSELELYARGLNAGVFTPALTTVNTDGMAWQNYRDGVDHLAVSWASRYLSERPADTMSTFLPGLAEQSYVLADGWAWAVADPQPARRLAAEMNVDLGQFPPGAFITSEMIRAAAGHQIGVYPPNALIVYGGGGHGKSLIELIRAAEEYRVVGLVDDGLPPGSEILGVPVLGGAEILPRLRRDGLQLAVNAVGGIGNLAPRLKVFERLAQSGFTIPTVVHPTALIEASAELAAGVQVMPFGYVGSSSRIGFGCIINTRAVVSHDCELGEYVNLAPGAVLAGGVQVGARTLIGMNVTINLEVRIGSGARIGNGATVKSDVPENGVVRAGTIWPPLS